MTKNFGKKKGRCRGDRGIGGTVGVSPSSPPPSPPDLPPLPPGSHWRLTPLSDSTVSPNGSLLEVTVPAVDSSVESTAGPSGLSCGVCGRRLRLKVDGTSGDICGRCLTEIFPFNSIASNRDFKEAILGFSLEGRHLVKASKLRLNPLDNDLKQALAGYDKTLGGCNYGCHSCLKRKVIKTSLVN